MHGTRTLLDLVSPDRQTRYPLPHYSGWSCNGGEFGEGDGRAILPMDLLTGLPEAFRLDPYGWSLDFFWWADGAGRPSTPLFSGCVTRASDMMGDGATWERELTLEVFRHHLLRRRLGVKEDFLPWVDGAGSMRAQEFGDMILSSLLSTPVFPTGRMTAHPGTRTDYRWWTILRAAPPTSLRDPEYMPPIQSGGNAWDAITDVCRVHDLWLSCQELDPAEWTFQIQESYVRRLLNEWGAPDPEIPTIAEQMVLSDATGVLDPVAFRCTTDWTTLANRFVSMGKGQTNMTDPQYGAWYEDEDSVALFGAFEDGRPQANGTTDANVLSAAAKKDIVGRVAPRVTVECVLVAMPVGWMFGVDWGHRDEVRVHHSRLLPDPVTLPVKGWAVNQPAEHAPVGLQLTLGDAPYDWGSHLRTMVGDLSGRSGGGLPVSKSR